MLRRHFLRFLPVSLVSTTAVAKPIPTKVPEFFLHPAQVKLMVDPDRVASFLKKFPFGCLLNQENSNILISECKWKIYNLRTLPVNGKLVDVDGSQYWYKEGQLHREDGPALIDVYGKQEWYKEGQLHREDGPAVIDVYGKQEWYKEGQLHREDGPALIGSNGCQYWYKEGKLHREDGPAVMRVDGSQSWYKEGKLHREDGPAVMRVDGSQSWYKEGQLHRGRWTSVD
jgi:hypothetical protein